VPEKIVIIGGSAAGPKAAARARRLDQNAEITLIQKENDLSMASCGYPYYVGGVFDNRNQLLSTPTGVVRDPKFFMGAKGITAHTNMEAETIDRDRKQVLCREIDSGTERVFPYDKLILSTGSNAKMPPVPGIELEGVTTLKTIQDADFLRKIRDDMVIRKAVVIGGGLIGIETCEALQLAGIEITVIEMLPAVLPFLDGQLARIIENHITAKGAQVITGNGLSSFLGENGKLTGVKLANGTELDCQLAVVAIGVEPNTSLAKKSGLKTGTTNGIMVNEFMQTSDPDIYAAGDCIETVHRVTGKPAYMPLGDLANLQGRVAGENVIKGNRARFKGTIKTSICKVFDYNAGSTGVSEKEARENGFDPVSVISSGPDRPGFMGAKILISKMTACRKTGRLLGYQCVGLGDASKQVGQVAMAIQGKLVIDEMVNADLPYAPPFSLAIDHCIATAQILQNKINNLLRGVSAEYVKQKVSNGEDIFLLDTRGPDEYKEMRLGIGETLIPLGVLRKRLEDLPDDKEKEIICFCKISLRGYEAALVLEANGWTNVKVMEGGIMAWPYPREK
jgi:NADPH-dependent 2,4-dienoyl-CoA reductase/sulfur reductase-like enzyme/rhodanese-related sulfurtransferase